MKHSLIHHAKHHLIGKFVSFIAAVWAAGLVSAFFEKKSSQNLWGVAGEKTTLSADAYHAIESTASVLIGFIALLFVDYLIETKKHVAAWYYIRGKAPVVKSEVKKYILKGKASIRSRLQKK